MALTASQKNAQAYGNGQTLRTYPIGGTETTFYSGEFIMVGADDNVAKVMSSSNVVGNQFVGIVVDEQTVAANGELTVAAGQFVLSGSGFTESSANELAFAATSAGLTATKTNGQLPVGRYMFSETSVNGKNAVFDIGTVVSGTSV